jgi:hypothetical protein
MVRRHEWLVPCYGEGVWDGAASAELEKALAAARQHAQAAGVRVDDGTVSVRPGDDTVIVYWVEEQDVPGDMPPVTSELRKIENELAALIGSGESQLHPSTLARVEALLTQVQRLIRRGP